MTLTTSVTSAPTLAHFSSCAATYVACDASGVAAGAVLSQRQEGSEHPIASALRTLTEDERKYSLGEREALALVWAYERWHIYLIRSKVHLRTAHHAAGIDNIDV